MSEIWPELDWFLFDDLDDRGRRRIAPMTILISWPCKACNKQVGAEVEDGVGQITMPSYSVPCPSCGETEYKTFPGRLVRTFALPEE